MEHGGSDPQTNGNSPQQPSFNPMFVSSNPFFVPLNNLPSPQGHPGLFMPLGVYFQPAIPFSNIPQAEDPVFEEEQIQAQTKLEYTDKKEQTVSNVPSRESVDSGISINTDIPSFEPPPLYEDPLDENAAYKRPSDTSTDGAEYCVPNSSLFNVFPPIENSAGSYNYEDVIRNSRDAYSSNLVFGGKYNRNNLKLQSKSGKADFDEIRHKIILHDWAGVQNEIICASDMGISLVSPIDGTLLHCIALNYVEREDGIDAFPLVSKIIKLLISRESNLPGIKNWQGILPYHTALSLNKQSIAELMKTNDGENKFFEEIVNSIKKNNWKEVYDMFSYGTHEDLTFFSHTQGTILHVIAANATEREDNMEFYQKVIRKISMQYPMQKSLKNCDGLTATNIASARNLATFLAIIEGNFTDVIVEKARSDSSLKRRNSKENSKPGLELKIALITESKGDLCKVFALSHGMPDVRVQGGNVFYVLTTAIDGIPVTIEMFEVSIDSIRVEYVKKAARKKSSDEVQLALNNTAHRSKSGKMSKGPAARLFQQINRRKSDSDFFGNTALSANERFHGVFLLYDATDANSISQVASYEGILHSFREWKMLNSVLICDKRNPVNTKVPFTHNVAQIASWNQLPFVEVCSETGDGTQLALSIAVRCILYGGAKKALFALMEANNKTAIAELIKSSEFLREIKFKKKSTLLQYAIDKCNTDIVSMLLNNGVCDCNIDKLYLKSCKLSSVVNIRWSVFKGLKELDLRDNCIKYLPMSLISLPSLNRVLLDGNPLKDVKLQKDDKVQWKELKEQLLNVIKRGVKYDKRLLMIVGQQGAGKTSLLQCLISKKNKSKISKDMLLEGISFISNIDLDVKKPEFHYSAWDFAGQEEFYAVHRIFLQPNATYVVVFNSINPDYSEIQHWIEQIAEVSANNGNASFILVGTHADNAKCTEEYAQHVDQKIKKIILMGQFRNLCKGTFLVNCENGGGIEKVKKKLLEIGLSPEYSSVVPYKWAMLSEVIKIEPSPFIEWNKFVEYMESCEIGPHEFDGCTKWLKGVGAILHFDEEIANLKDLVVLDPCWLASVMRSLISSGKNWVDKGILKSSDAAHIFSFHSGSIRSTLLPLLERFGLTQKMRGSDGRYLVASLLPSRKPLELINSSFPFPIASYSFEFGRKYQLETVPWGLFPKLMVGIMHIPDIKIEFIWRNGISIQRSSEKALIEFNEIKRSVNVEFRINRFDGGTDLFRRIVECCDSAVEYLDGVVKLIPCVHCISKALHHEEPYYFKYSDIVEAVSSDSVFVFCRGIVSANRSVRIDYLAPDIASTDIPVVDASEFTVETLLGKGGFGEVYQGKMGDKDIAIKEVKYPLDSDNDTLDRVFASFQREAYITSFLSHPNLVSMYGISVKPSFKILLEYVPHGDLYRFMHPKGEIDSPTSLLSSIDQTFFPWKLRLRIALDIAKGMRYMHSINPPVIHRDLRSPNIFLCSTDPNAATVAKVADFGLAAIVAPTVGGAMPTWRWCAPEVFQASHNSTYDERADVYSCGILFWEIATRCIPFDEYIFDDRFSAVVKRGGTEVERSLRVNKIKHAIAMEELRPSAPLPSEECPSAFWDLIQRMWCGNISQRPSFHVCVEVLSNLLGISDDCTGYLNNEPMVVQKWIPKANKERPTIEEMFRPLQKIHLPEGNHVTAMKLIFMKGADVVWIGCSNGNIFIYDFFICDNPITCFNCGNKRVTSLVQNRDLVWVGTEEGIKVFDTNLVCIHSNNVPVKKLVRVQSEHGIHVWHTEASSYLIHRWNAQNYVEETSLNISDPGIISAIETVPSLNLVVFAIRNTMYLYTRDTLLQVAKWKVSDKGIVTCIYADSESIWTGCKDGKIFQYDLDVLNEYAVTKRNEAYCDEKNLRVIVREQDLLICGANVGVAIWNIEDLTAVQELNNIHHDSVYAIVSNKGRIWYHDISTGVGRMRDGKLTFSGCHIKRSGSLDGTIQIIERQQPQVLQRPPPRPPRKSTIIGNKPLLANNRFLAREASKLLLPPNLLNLPARSKDIEICLNFMNFDISIEGLKKLGRYDSPEQYNKAVETAVTNLSLKTSFQENSAVYEQTRVQLARIGCSEEQFALAVYLGFNCKEFMDLIKQASIYYYYHGETVELFDLERKPEKDSKE